MTPNPNPSPERERLKYYPDYIDDPDGLERFRQAVLSNSGHDMAAVNHNSLGRLIDTIERLRRERDAALSPQTLAAPGEVEHIADAGNMVEVECIRRAIWGYVNAQPEDAAMLPLVQFLANRDVFLAEAIAPATVAAANDEAFTRGVEAAAKVADAEERAADAEMASYDSYGGPPLPARAAEAQRRGAARSIAAAIRLLPQGGGRA